ncbi:MAG: radical SAM protein [Candidatus Methanoperedens sp.]|nr:radical SAM protein [Candidatus Methanoperedens sp.]MCZ7371141.1 radical SAM protein [Candidatus Methanoperedens sp.]
MGTLGVLGLELVQMDTPPTTAYLQIYTEKRCKANCQFCAQASGASADLIHIARGLYVPVDLDAVVSRLKIAFDRGYLARACIQTALYDKWWLDTVYLIKSIRAESKIPISLSVFPLSDRKYLELIQIGVGELVIPLDACTPELFGKIKGNEAGGPYSWDEHLDGMKRAARLFNKVGTHLIIGLGESDEEAVRIIRELWKSNICPALFSYTYVPGAQLRLYEKSNSMKHYRTVQLARHLIVEGEYSEMRFSNGELCDFGATRDLIIELIEDGRAFQTSGCPDCNRPMANETFSKMYNFPRKPNPDEIEGIKKELGELIL